MAVVFYFFMSLRYVLHWFASLLAKEDIFKLRLIQQFQLLFHDCQHSLNICNLIHHLSESWLVVIYYSRYTYSLCQRSV